jgi:hypothetical protein
MKCNAADGLLTKPSNIEDDLSDPYSVFLSNFHLVVGDRFNFGLEFVTGGVEPFPSGCGL